MWQSEFSYFFREPVDPKKVSSYFTSLHIVHADIKMITPLSCSNKLHAKMAQLLGLLTTDPRACDWFPGHDQTFTQSVESRQLSVILGVEITRCGQIERKDQGLSISIASQCPKTTFRS